MALDWAVAQIEDRDVRFYDGILRDMESWDEWDSRFQYSPSTNWSQCGPLIERYKPSIQLKNIVDPSVVWAYVGLTLGEGPTYLIAACRAIVAAKLGDEVDVPAELLNNA